MITDKSSIRRGASLSECGTYRWTLTRDWDERPKLLLCMFNPATADASVDDQTILLMCHIASHNGYGGIVVVNGLPLRSSDPELAVAMLNWEKENDLAARDRLHENLAFIRQQVAEAGAVMLGWGNLAAKCPTWFEAVTQEINASLPPGSQLYCLGKTVKGFPKHPMALGKNKVPKDAPLLPWAVA